MRQVVFGTVHCFVEFDFCSQLVTIYTIHDTFVHRSSQKGVIFELLEHVDKSIMFIIKVIEVH